MNSSPCRCLVLLSCLALTLEVRAAEFKPTINDGITKAGDVMTYALPVAAMSVAACLKDGDVGAAFVGYSRVRAHEHYIQDVAAAGAIAIVTTYLMTTPYHGWSIQPEWTARRRGLKLSREF